VKHVRDFIGGVYRETVTQFALNGMLDLPGFLPALADKSKWRTLAGWFAANWSGLARSSVDLLNDVKAAKESVNLGIATFDYHSRKLFGTSFKTVMQRLQRERAIMREAGFVSSVDENQNGEPARGEEAARRLPEEGEMEAEIRGAFGRMGLRVL
jgi:capsid protein